LDAIGPDRFKDCLVRVTYFRSAVAICCPAVNKFCPRNFEFKVVFARCFLQFSVPSRCSPSVVSVFGSRDSQIVQGYWWARLFSVINVSELDHYSLRFPQSFAGCRTLPAIGPVKSPLAISIARAQVITSRRKFREVGCSHRQRTKETLYHRLQQPWHTSRYTFVVA